MYHHVNAGWLDPRRGARVTLPGAARPEPLDPQPAKGLVAGHHHVRVELLPHVLVDHPFAGLHTDPRPVQRLGPHRPDRFPDRFGDARAHPAAPYPTALDRPGRAEPSPDAPQPPGRAPHPRAEPRCTAPPRGRGLKRHHRPPPPAKPQPRPPRKVRRHGGATHPPPAPPRPPTPSWRPSTAPPDRCPTGGARSGAKRAPAPPPAAPSPRRDLRSGSARNGPQPAVRSAPPTDRPADAAAPTSCPDSTAHADASR